MGRFFIGGLVLVVAGCASIDTLPDRESYLAEATKEYRGITRERFFQAAEMSLKANDPLDWQFQHSPDGFTGFHKYAYYAVLAVSSGVEQWNISATEVDGVLKASVSVGGQSVTTGTYSAPSHAAGDGATASLYRLFWARVDYVLGLRTDWISCPQAYKQLEEQGIGSGSIAALCGHPMSHPNAKPARLAPSTAAD